MKNFSLNFRIFFESENFQNLKTVQDTSVSETETETENENFQNLKLKVVFQNNFVEIFLLFSLLGWNYLVSEKFFTKIFTFRFWKFSLSKKRKFRTKLSESEKFFH